MNIVVPILLAFILAVLLIMLVVSHRQKRQSLKRQQEAEKKENDKGQHEANLQRINDVVDSHRKIRQEGQIKEQTQALNKLKETLEKAQSTPQTVKENVSKYQTSSLTLQDKNLYMSQLLIHMEKEKPFLDNELTVENLARNLDISSHKLSEVLNEMLGKNFYDFINMYRVEEAKRKITDPKESYKKIIALAYESGFNSKTSFNRVFKTLTGLTPSDYKEKYTKK